MHQKKDNFKKLVIVTGVTGGIGKAVARVLAGEGYALLLTGRDAKTLHAFQKSLVKEFPSISIETHVLDLNKSKNIVSLFTKKHIDYSTLYGLVNVAGVAVGGDIFSLKESDWDTDMQINLKAPFLLTQHFVQTVKNVGHNGSVVNISSLAGVVGAKKPNYSASKAGLIGLTKSVALAVGKFGIRVNAIVPGAVDTSMIADWDTKKRTAIIEKIPVGFIAEPNDIAQSVSFLLSEKARYITGTALNVTGGQYTG